MSKLPTELKLTLHAQQRLEERKNNYIYNTKNLMKSSCRWYGKDDLIPNSKLYIHCLYVCRKARNKMGYLTDGNIEVLYDKNAGVAITVMEVKEKFQPITQYIKPSVLKEIEIKKEKKKMRKKLQYPKGICPDCGKEVELTIHNVCHKCMIRKTNALRRGKEYVPYVNLSEIGKRRVDMYQEVQRRRNELLETAKVAETTQPVPVVENYYQAKAEQKPVAPITTIIPTTVQSTIKIDYDPLTDPNSFVSVLRGCGCEIPEDSLREVLDVLLATDKLKNIFMTIAKSDSQQAMLDLEQALNVVERKLQHDWEFNGFREEDDVKFKGFLTWRRVLKGAIFFWKKLYQTGTLIELQRAWNSYTADPTEKVVMSGDRMSSALKRYQITTDSISTIFNTRRPFTRVFYATSEEDAHEKFVKWMSDRQLHEDKSKTTITELTSEGEDGRKEND